MCDSCAAGLSDDIIRGIFYGLLKKVLTIKPVKSVVDAVDKGVESIGIGSTEVYAARSDHDIGRKTALYVVASWFYENYVFNMTKNMLTKGQYLGICSCEVMRDIYLVIILQIYSSYMHGFRLETLITDTLSVFGAEYVNGIVSKVPAIQSLYVKKNKSVMDVGQRNAVVIKPEDDQTVRGSMAQPPPTQMPNRRRVL